MTNVHIIDKATGKTASVIKTHLRGENYEATKREWEDTAWKAAVSDGDVDSDKRDNYEFKFVDDPAPGTPPRFAD